MSKQDISACHINPANDDGIRIIQITDTHIQAEGEQLFNGFDTSISLVSVLQDIKKHEFDADLLLVTGDLVHEPNDQSYQRLADHLGTLTLPVFYLPGNHDQPAKMDKVLGDNGFDQSNLIISGNWAIVLLNSSIVGEHAGKLDNAELLFLAQCLAAYPEHHVLIALHHHPVSIASSWMDGMALLNPDALFDVIADKPGVKGVIWGHIHQAFDTKKEQLKLMGTPSTCVQFLPAASSFAIDESKSPAYRKLLLGFEGEIETDVKYVDN